MQFKLEGVNELHKALQQHLEATGRAFNRGITAAGHEIYQVSQGIVPVDTGALKASGVTYTEGTGWQTVCIVGYGTEVTGYERVPSQYAIIVEEYHARFYLHNAVEASDGIVSNLVFQEVSRA
jgi:hypothetical protein